LMVAAFESLGATAGRTAGERDLDAPIAHLDGSTISRLAVADIFLVRVKGSRSPKGAVAELRASETKLLEALREAWRDHLRDSGVVALFGEEVEPALIRLEVRE